MLQNNTCSPSPLPFLTQIIKLKILFGVGKGKIHQTGSSPRILIKDSQKILWETWLPSYNPGKCTEFGSMSGTIFKCTDTDLLLKKGLSCCITSFTTYVYEYVYIYVCIWFITYMGKLVFHWINKILLLKILRLKGSQLDSHCPLVLWRTVL